MIITRITERPIFFHFHLLGKRRKTYAENETISAYRVHLVDFSLKTGKGTD